MILEAATNCWTNAEDVLADAVKNSAKFQQLTGTADEDEAALRIYREEWEQPEDESDHYTDEAEWRGQAHAIISSATTNPYGTKRSDANPSRWIPYGKLVLEIFRAVPPEDSEDTRSTEATDRYFKNRVGSLLDEITSFTAEQGGLWITQIDIVEGPIYVDKEAVPQQFDIQAITALVSWEMPS